jgi:hypothetical protein
MGLKSSPIFTKQLGFKLLLSTARQQSCTMEILLLGALCSSSFRGVAKENEVVSVDDFTLKYVISNYIETEQKVP